MKDPLRLRNHLRQAHRITDKATIDHYVQQSVVLLDNELVEKESELHSSSSSFLSDDENDLIRQVADQENIASERFFDKESEAGNLYWSAEVSLGLVGNVVIPKRPCSQAHFSASESDDNDFEYFSDDDKYDFEVLELKFLFSSLEEDVMISGFRKQLASVKGSEKPSAQVNKDKRIVMSIVRHNNDEARYYKYLACLTFLKNWMAKLNKENKEPGTIKTYLKSVKYFIVFWEMERNNTLKEQNVPQANI